MSLSAQPSALSASEFAEELSEIHPGLAHSISVLLATCKRDMSRPTFLPIPSQEEIDELLSQGKAKCKDLTFDQARVALYSALGTAASVSFLSSRVSDDPLLTQLSHQLSYVVMFTARLYDLSAEDVSRLVMETLRAAKDDILTQALLQTPQE